MPTGQPFTQLCRQLAERHAPTRADLHIHTTHSDGTYTPAEVVTLAKKANLKAIAITDHDTLAALSEATAITPPGLEIIPGVEISCEHQGRGLHLLGYFVKLDHEPLNRALEQLQRRRADRFEEMVARCSQAGLSLDQEYLAHLRASTGSLGRRHLAAALVMSGHATTIQSAFHRWLQNGGPITVPWSQMSVAEAIALVRSAGGVASWAHPPSDCELSVLKELREMGLRALESEYPYSRRERRRELRSLAEQAELSVSGGSDCHGPAPAGRNVGGCGLNDRQLRALRANCL